jgi:hypothetical protein
MVDMLHVGPDDLQKLIVETQSPRQILDGKVRDILFTPYSCSPDPDPIFQSDQELEFSAQIEIEREHMAGRVGNLQVFFADIEANMETSIFRLEDIDSVMKSLTEELLVRNDFKTLEHLLRGGVLSDEVITDPGLTKMAKFVCLDQISCGVITSLPYVAQQIIPDILDDEKYIPAIKEGLRAVLSQGQLREATYFILTYPKAKDILAEVLSAPDVADMIITAQPGPQTTGFTSFFEVRGLLASDEVQNKIEETLKRFTSADRLELVVDMLREQLVTDRTKHSVREYAAQIVQAHLSEIHYYEEAEGRELEKARDRIQKQCQVVERLVKSLEQSGSTKTPMGV